MQATLHVQRKRDSRQQRHKKNRQKALNADGAVSGTTIRIGLDLVVSLLAG
jgi:hypothetical protein